MLINDRVIFPKATFWCSQSSLLSPLSQSSYYLNVINVVPRPWLGVPTLDSRLDSRPMTIFRYPKSSILTNKFAWLVTSITEAVVECSEWWVQCRVMPSAINEQISHSFLTWWPNFDCLTPAITLFTSKMQKLLPHHRGSSWYYILRGSIK